MRNPGGYVQIVTPVSTKLILNSGLHCEEIGEGTTEIDTFSCCHCQGVVHVVAGDRSADEYFCRNCMARICSPCADHPCTPFMRKIEEAETRRRHYMIKGK